jgi:hypothetical protein
VLVAALTEVEKISKLVLNYRIPSLYRPLIWKILLGDYHDSLIHSTLLKQQMVVVVNLNGVGVSFS